MYKILFANPVTYVKTHSSVFFECTHVNSSFSLAETHYRSTDIFVKIASYALSNYLIIMRMFCYKKYLRD